VLLRDLFLFCTGAAGFLFLLPFGRCCRFLGVFVLFNDRVLVNKEKHVRAEEQTCFSILNNQLFPTVGLGPVAN
jgi:hypothetical protein